MTNITLKYKGVVIRMKKIISIAVCLLMVVGTFSACRAGLYMEDFVDVQWTCNDIELQFTYTSENSEMGIGTLVKDNETIDIVCMFSLSKHIEIYDKSKFDPTDGIDLSTALLVGHYKIKDNIATVTIVKDNLFGGNYLNKVFYLQMTPLS